MSDDSVPVVRIKRDEWIVAAGGEELPRVDLEAKHRLYGNFDWTRSTIDSLLGEKEGWVTLSWNAEINRETPHRDDPYPLSMPETIANVGFHVEEDSDGNPVSLNMTHLYVQEKARRQGYGQLLWDCYLAVAVYGDLELVGGVGSTEEGGTAAFLERQGVPRRDIIAGRKAGGEGLTQWRTDLDNVASKAPVTETRTE